MRRTQANAIGVIAYTALVAAVTFLITDHLHQSEQVAPVYAQEVRTAANDVALETIPGKHSDLPAPTLPKGGTIKATAEIHIAARSAVLVANPSPPAADLPELSEPERVAVTHEPAGRCLRAEDFTCPPLDLRLDLAQLDDGQQYLAVKGPDGVEITGRYLPRAAVPAVRMNKAAIDLYADDSKVIRYQRRVFHRFWIGPAAMIEPAGTLVGGASLEGEW